MSEVQSFLSRLILKIIMADVFALGNLCLNVFFPNADCLETNLKLTATLYTKCIFV